MAHKVTFQLPERDLGNTTMVLEVTDSRGKVGRLKISKGRITWVPLNKSIGHTMSWRQFHRILDAHFNSEE